MLRETLPLQLATPKERLSAERKLVQAESHAERLDSSLSGIRSENDTNLGIR